MKKFFVPLLFITIFITVIIIFSIVFRPVVSPAPESSGVTLILLSPTPAR